jgi:hypothetical protein
MELRATVDPWPTTAPSDPFDRAQRQLLDEERALRAVAEGQVREFRRLVVEFASAFVAEELDARRRADPRFTERATPADWRQLLRSARQGQPGSVRWLAAQRAPDQTARWQAEAERLASEVDRLVAELALRPVQTTPAPESAHRENDVSNEPSAQGQVRQPPGPVPFQPPPVKPGLSPRFVAVVEPLGLADVRLPGLPPVAPARFAGQLQAWPREALALAILAVTGWSMRLTIADQMSAALGSVKASAGSLRRTFSVLARRGYWIEQKLTLAGVHAPMSNAEGAEADVAPTRGPAEDTVLVLVRLGDLGRDLLAACGIQPRPSEWELLEAAYGTPAVADYSGLVCAFTYQARLRGYATSLAPPENYLVPSAGRGKTDPAVLVRKGDDTLQVAVATKSQGGELWQAQAVRQDRAAFVTLTPDLRARLVAQAQAAGAEHGLATDLQTLFNTQEASGPLWVVAW